MIQNHQLWFTIWARSNKKISRMQVGVHKTILKNHVIKTFRNQFRQVAKIDSLIVDFPYMSYWGSSFVRHHKDSRFSKFCINGRDMNLGIVLKYFSASITIFSLDRIIKLSRQFFVEFLRKPSIFKFREEISSSI